MDSKFLTLILLLLCLNILRLRNNLSFALRLLKIECYKQLKKCKKLLDSTSALAIREKSTLDPLLLRNIIKIPARVHSYSCTVAIRKYERQVRKVEVVRSKIF